MKPFTSLLFIVLLHQLISVTVSQPNYLYSFCNDDVNYTANSTYRQNLNALLSNFSTSDIPDGFYNLSVGNPPDQVYGVVLCRGDVSQAACRSCVNDSTVKILQNCPNQIEAIGYYENCILRFTNRSIFGVVSQGSIRTYYMWNRNVSASELDGFNRALQSLLSNLSTTAALGDSRKKFATGSSVAGFSTIYGLTQCTPDISGQDCENCLRGSVSEIPARMAGKVGGRILKPNCNFRYEIYRFTQNTVAPPPPPTLVEQTPASQGSPSPPPLEGKSSNTERTVLLIVVPAVGVAILIICIFLCYKKQNPKRKLERINDKYVDEIEEETSLQFDFDTISAVTNDFSDQNKLGEGGFGAVYKGTFMNGQDVAVKRLSANSGQGDLEFKTEVRLVAKLQHRNLVRLLGFCLEGVERLLIYEFMPNKSLDYFIFDLAKRTYLKWDRRHKIIEGIAKGLVYLHEDSRLRIIHRDLKASNILLDEEMNPKIADFGMARLFVVNQTQAETNRIVGTYGYMAPEYAMHGHFSVKSDVYSFGVLILEIVSGQKNSDFQNGVDIDLLSFAWRNWREGTYMNIVDPSLVNGSTSEIMRCIHIGLLCVQENVDDRPTMDSIVLMLNSYSLALSVPSQPAFFIRTNTESNRISINEVSITALSGR